MRITLEEAAEIVLELARDELAALIEEDVSTPSSDSEEARARQEEAIKVVEDHFVNHVFDGCDDT